MMKNKQGWYIFAMILKNAWFIKKNMNKCLENAIMCS